MTDGILTETQASFLRRAVRDRRNIVIAGAASTGKTTLAKLLCRLYGMPALDFDGSADSLYHPYGEGSARMEFLTSHGEFDDLPYEFVMDRMRRTHPGFLQDSGTARGGSLAAESSHSQT